MSRYTKPKYDPLKLKILANLRQEVNLSLSQVARFFKMGRRGYESVSNWENGISKPRTNRRGRFITYLLDELMLRRNYSQFLQVWQEVMIEEWGWDPLIDEELQFAFPGHALKAVDLSPQYLAHISDVASHADDLTHLAQLIADNTATTPQRIQQVLWWMLTDIDLREQEHQTLEKVTQRLIQIQGESLPTRDILLLPPGRDWPRLIQGVVIGLTLLLLTTLLALSQNILSNRLDLYLPSGRPVLLGLAAVVAVLSLLVWLLQWLQKRR